MTIASPQRLLVPPTARVLALAALPGDELRGAAGTLCLHAEQGDHVHVLCLHGTRSGAEYRTALAGGLQVAVSEYEFLGLSTGAPAEAGDVLAVSARIAQSIRTLRPQTIYAPHGEDADPIRQRANHRVRLALHMAGYSGRAWSYSIQGPFSADFELELGEASEQRAAALMALGDEDLVFANLEGPELFSQVEPLREADRRWLARVC